MRDDKTGQTVHCTVQKFIRDRTADLDIVQVIYVQYGWKQAILNSQNSPR